MKILIVRLPAHIDEAHRSAPVPTTPGDLLFIDEDS